MNVFSRKPAPRDGGEETDPVWNLLAESPLSEPDAWFAARTLARCRNTMPTPETASSFLSRAWRWATGTGLGVCAAVLLLANIHFHHSRPAIMAGAPPSQKGVQEAFEILASMSPDDSSANNSSWQDSSL